LDHRCRLRDGQLVAAEGALMARFRGQGPSAELAPREHQLTLGERIEELARKAEVLDPTRPAMGVLACVLALMGLGLIIQVSHASTTVMPDAFMGEVTHLLSFRVAGVAILLIMMRIGPARLRPFIPFLSALSILSLILVFLPVAGVSANGSHRWMRIPGIGLTFQPSEIARVVIVLWVSLRCIQLGDRVRDMRSGYLPMLAFGLVLSGLILFEPDLGGALLFIICYLCTMWVGGARPAHVAGSLGMMFLTVLGLMATILVHAQERIAVWLGNSSNAQVDRTIEAMASGDLVGVGLTHGGWRNGGLQYHQTDFVFTLFGEELGLFGTLLIVGILLAFAWNSMRLVLSINDRFSALVAFGLLISVALQAMLHVQIATGLAPPKGMNLPFISDGGTSLLASCLAVGLALGAARPVESSTPYSTSS
jgi:cell division protein FtsW